MKYLLAVDGGGTKTEFCIYHLESGTTKTYLVPGSNYKTVGLEETYNHLEKGMKLIEEELNITADDIAYSVWGLSGCDVPKDYEIMRELMGRLGFSEERSHLCNDGVLGFFAQAAAPGLVLISGTGSIIIGVDKMGNSIRRGGWGQHISDIGSGYWVGNEALLKTLLYCDGAFPYSKLFDRVKEELHTQELQKLPYLIMDIQEGFKVANFARFVTEVAGEGDELCLSILQKGASVLAQLAKSAYDQLQFQQEKEIGIVLSGGLFKSKLYQELIKKELGKQISLENVTFYDQKNPPTLGGIYLAKQKLYSKR